MKKAIKSIYSLFLILFTIIFLTNAKAAVVDLKDYEKKPASILRSLLKIISKSTVQICHLNGPAYSFNTNYIVFNPKIEILLPDSIDNQYVVNCMFLEEYSFDNILETPHCLSSLHNSLKSIENSLIMPIEIQWTYETIRIMVASSFNGKKFSHQIILNIDSEENHRLERSTLTSTLRPTTTNEKNNINYASSSEEESKIEDEHSEDEESENDSSSEDEDSYTPPRLAFIKVSQHFDLSDSSTDDDSSDALSVLFEEYIDYISHERETKLKQLRQVPSENLYQDNVMQYLEKMDDSVKQQSLQIIKLVDFLRRSQVMYLSDFDEPLSISQKMPEKKNYE